LVADGGLMSYGPDLADQYRRAVRDTSDADARFLKALTVAHPR
jgi:hypothetical protein